LADPIRGQLANLLGAYGYNLYDQKNRLRADDLLVREKAAEQLGEAANCLRSLRTAFSRRFLPPPTRENPSPPPERLAQLREIARLQERLADLETRIRSMAVPTQDRVWERVRSEKLLLSQLLVHDYNLVAPSHDLCERAQGLTAAEWSDEIAAALEDLADRVERAVRARVEFLRVPGA
jgi:hypothetical protein